MNSSTIICRFHTGKICNTIITYPGMTSSSLPQGVSYVAAAADCGSDDRNLYNLSIDRGFELLCPVSATYNHASSARMHLLNFYDSKLGQTIHSCRGISEPV